MPRYEVTLTEEETKELKAIIQKGGKGYRIRHAQILLKLDKRPENKSWTYDRIKEAYGAVHSTIAGVAKRFVTEGLEAALGRKSRQTVIVRLPARSRPAYAPLPVPIRRKGLRDGRCRL